MTERSIVEYFSGHESYRCGYCKSDNTCYSHGMWAHILTALDYQNLIDRGWRRSGKYCYKPTMNLTCCPQYTIRCEAKKFVLTRSQKKVLKRVHKFLAHGDKNSHAESKDMGEEEMEVTSFPSAVDMQSVKNIRNVREIKQTDIETDDIESVHPQSTSATQNQESGIPSSVVPSNLDSSHAIDSSGDSSVQCNTSNIDPNKPLCRKAKVLRRERKLQKLLKMGISTEQAVSSMEKRKNEPKSVEDFLSEPFQSDPEYKLELRLVPCDTESVEFLSSFDESYSLYKKYQMTIHGDKEEECNITSFEDFLVETPLEPLDDTSSSNHIYGSFHQQYWLNDKLIAVGVIDILPYCVSSVYFYYDPDYSSLSLGTYAALREIAFTRELSTKHPDLQYYYMGFYIHSCVKMRYKGQYYPSYLLCPETYIFQPIERCKPKLDVSKYHRLEEDLTKEDRDGVVILKEVLILCDKKQMTYPYYASLHKYANDEDIVKEYARFVGRKCYRRMLLYRS